MSKAECEQQDLTPTRRPTHDVGCTCLSHLLNLLVAALERTRAGDPFPEARRSEAPERWEDEGHVYLESGLLAVPGSEIDICIHDGRAHIRIER